MIDKRNSDEAPADKPVKKGRLDFIRQKDFFAFFKHPIFLGGWLLFLFYFNIATVLMSLSAHKLHHNISLIEVNDRPTSVSQIQDFKRDMELRQERDEMAGKIFKKRKAELEPIHKKITEMKEKLADELDEKERTKLTETLAQHEHYFQCEFAQAKDDYNKVIMASVKLINRAIDQHGFQSFPQKTPQKEDKDPDGDKNNENNPNTPPPPPSSTTSGELENTEGSQKAQTSQITKTSELQSYACSEKHKWDASTLEFYKLLDSDVAGAIADLKYFESLSVNTDEITAMVRVKTWIKTVIPFEKPGWLRIWEITKYSQMPTELLTIIVILSMGALGGTIRLTRNYLNPHRDERFANYIFYPLLGAVTALSVYILAKAGILVISDTGAKGNKGDLSPYFISFIGLVSGLLADKALDTIERVGLRWFKDSEAGQKRWGIDLPEKCENKRVTVTELADLTGNPPKAVESWFMEKSKVPPFAQKLIAARLNLQTRELFTDIRPTHLSKET